MRRTSFILSLFIVITTASFSQNLTREEVSLNIKLQKHGEYKFYYKNKLQVHGYYRNGEKQGKWTYQIDPNYRMIGNYKNNKQDSVWDYYLNKKPYLSINYNTGESKCYNPDGSLRSKRDSMNHQLKYVEFDKNGKPSKQVISDSIFTFVKDFDRNANIIGQITFKKNFPYEILHNKYYTETLLYEGELIKGTGKLLIKDKTNLSNEFYLSEVIELKDSKPDGIYEEYSTEGKLRLKGNFRQGFMVGKWEKYSKSGELEKAIEYSINDSITEDKKESIYVSMSQYILHDEMPQFPGKPNHAIKELMKFLGSTTKYPEIAQRKGISGRVYMQFVIYGDGKVSDIKVVKGVNPLLDYEAYRVIDAMPYWRPGIQKGIPVRIQMSIPINFKLE